MGYTDLYTYQDFALATASGIPDLICAAVKTAIDRHRTSARVFTAIDADSYDRQCNSTITNCVRWLYAGDKRVPDTESSNNKLCSNFFRRLNTQRVTYSLGNGVSFQTEGLKDRLGDNFDTRLKDAGYYALIHGVSFLFWNVDHLHVFKYTEFCPLWDEETGELKAGIRYWQIDHNKPVMAVLYELDGFTKLRAPIQDGQFEIVEPKRAYRLKTVKAPADSEPEIVGEENYSGLPIVPLYGSSLKQSTLVGLKAQIDAYDLIRSGFANDLNDCSEIYWLVSNAGGMTDKDLARFRQRLKHDHIANVADGDDVQITPYTQEVPYASRQAFLSDLRAQIYEDFGGLDVHTVAAGATNDHIQAAYQPMDEQADDFEYQVIEAVQQLLKLIGVNDTPLFTRNRISNQTEATNMVLSAAQYLDDETILRKLPFITPDEIDSILKARDADDVARFSLTPAQAAQAAPDNAQAPTQEA